MCGNLIEPVRLLLSSCDVDAAQSDQMNEDKGKVAYIHISLCHCDVVVLMSAGGTII